MTAPRRSSVRHLLLGTAGLLLAAAAATALRGVLYNVTPFDPLAWGLALSAMLAAADTLVAAGITHKRARLYRPKTNGKVERFNRTLLAEWMARGSPVGRPELAAASGT